MSQLNAVTLKILRDMEDHTLTVGDYSDTYAHIAARDNRTSRKHPDKFL